MSVVTNVILTVPCWERRGNVCERINEFFEPGSGFRNIGDAAGGTKHLEADVLVGAFNYFDLGAFIDHLNTIRFENPENVCLFVKEQEDDRFIERIWRRRDLEIGVN